MQQDQSLFEPDRSTWSDSLRAGKVGMGSRVSTAQEGRKTGGLLEQALQGPMTGSPMEALTLVSTLVSLPVCTVTPALLCVSVSVSAWSSVRLALLATQC